MSVDKGSVLRKLHRNGLVNDIKPFALNTHYEVIMGSFAYGVSSDTSDVDLYSVFTPPMEYVFPHTAGFIHRFAEPAPVYDNYQKHNLVLDGKTYDVNNYNIVRYVHLCMENNPNMIDSLFVPDRCIVHIDGVGDILRENRKNFLHKGICKRLKGYAYQQMKKIRTKESHGNRAELVEKYGYDTKFAYHVVRLVQQAEMVLTTGDLDLEDNRELLKSIRRGDWTLDELEAWFKKRDGELDELYLTSDLPYSPNVDMIKEIMFQCLEAHFGSLSHVFNIEGDNQLMSEKLSKIRKVLDGDL